MIHSRTRLALLMLALAACATVPPVQEMSDARQAIGSAEAVGAAQRAPETLNAAQTSLQKAQTSLESGAYDDARRHALDARKQAIQARQTALKPPPVPKRMP